MRPTEQEVMVIGKTICEEQAAPPRSQVGERQGGPEAEGGGRRARAFVVVPREGSPNLGEQAGTGELLQSQRAWGSGCLQLSGTWPWDIGAGRGPEGWLFIQEVVAGESLDRWICMWKASLWEGQSLQSLQTPRCQKPRVLTEEQPSTRQTGGITTLPEGLVSAPGASPCSGARVGLHSSHQERPFCGCTMFWRSQGGHCFKHADSR